MEQLFRIVCFIVHNSVEYSSDEQPYAEMIKYCSECYRKSFKYTAAAKKLMTAADTIVLDAFDILIPPIYYTIPFRNVQDEFFIYCIISHCAGIITI